MAKPAKRKVQGGGRVTPKGGSVASRSATKPSTNAPEASSRYTPPIPPSVKVSPIWVPILMFVLLGAGTLVILINYTDTLWGTSNWYLLGGLTSILGGIITATQYH
ncbi:MAG: cell division protein CrgA [Acidimicrobiales bacterium]